MENEVGGEEFREVKQMRWRVSGFTYMDPGRLPVRRNATDHENFPPLQGNTLITFTEV
jgi:hypothetical protein